MKILSSLSPAETLLILKPSSTTADLMKFTLMDLLMRDVLHLLDFNTPVSLGQPRMGNSRITRGKKFGDEEPRLNEMIFLAPFYKKPESKIVVKHLIQMGMSIAKNESHYKEKLLLDDVEMKGLYKKSFFNKVFGGLKLNDEGKRIRNDIILYFSKLDLELPPMIKNEPQKAKEILHSIKGNVLLLNSVKFEFIQVIGKEIAIIQDEIEGNS